jgi:hypothetical protein
MESLGGRWCWLSHIIHCFDVFPPHGKPVGDEGLRCDHDGEVSFALIGSTRKLILFDP